MPAFANSQYGAISRFLKSAQALSLSGVNKRLERTGIIRLASARYRGLARGGHASNVPV
jgi:hypothetical protein